jgi:hypothetical protein
MCVSREGGAVKTRSRKAVKKATRRTTPEVHIHAALSAETVREIVRDELRRLEAADAHRGEGGWLAPETAPHDGRTRTLVLAILSDGSVMTCTAAARHTAEDKWYIEGTGWFADIRGWLPLPEIPAALRGPTPSGNGWRPIGTMGRATTGKLRAEGHPEVIGTLSFEGRLFDQYGNAIPFTPTEWQEIRAS